MEYPDIFHCYLVSVQQNSRMDGTYSSYDDQVQVQSKWCIFLYTMCNCTLKKFCIVLIVVYCLHLTY